MGWREGSANCKNGQEVSQNDDIDMVTWSANFIQLTPSRRALWRVEKRQLEKN